MTLSEDFFGGNFNVAKSWEKGNLAFSRNIDILNKPLVSDNYIGANRKRGQLACDKLKKLPNRIIFGCVVYKELSKRVLWDTLYMYIWSSISRIFSHKSFVKNI